MRRLSALALAILLLALGIWFLPRPAPDRHEARSPDDRSAEPAALPPIPADDSGPGDKPAVTPGALPDGKAPPEEPPRATTDSTTKPTEFRVDTLPFEQKKADGFVKIDIDDGRVEVEGEGPPERVFTFDLYATLDGELTWLAGNDGVADLRANLELGNRKYLKERRWSRLRSGLAFHGVESGADVEVRITYFDLEGRKLEEERYRFSAP